MTDPELWWTRRSEIEDQLAERLRDRSTEAWLTVLDAADVWCAPVLTLPQLVAHEGFAAIGMTQTVRRAGLDGREHVLTTTRSPLRIDGAPLLSDRPAPRLGEHDDALRTEFAPVDTERLPAR